ncbi:hypothetical protein [Plantactinospora endophytica]|uniref:4Fe-4S Wbl-type domain-containing protein n=1 Tax=Plantactinospora endophytica TaxID=673535 RepID=A0ABQ4DW83_9ACTN|nr:hypothetical protein [Plantactinospora endophytica]GIG86704.1 hypothetical protein Pen02_16400 [Plantactinospora endophytica]
MIRLVRRWLAVEWPIPVDRVVARLVLGRHALRECVHCGPDGCPLWSWAAEVHRREHAVRVLLGGTLPAQVTAGDVRAALDRLR